MPDKKPDRKQNEVRGDPVSLAPVPFEEAVADLLKVKRPEGKGKAKKGQSRDRKKRKV